MMTPTKAKKKPPTPSTIRWNENDYRIIEALQEKKGVKIPELVREGLRILAAKEGVTA